MPVAEQFLMTITGQPMPLRNTTGSDFGPSGTSHAKGLVPDPGTTVGSSRALFEDGAWRTPAAATTAAFAFVIDGAGSAITTGVKGDVLFTFGCTINSATLLADQSGSIVVNIWKDTYTNYPPTVADKITASAPPTISTATKSQDTTLTGWTTTISANDTLRFNVDSAASITRATLILGIART